MTMKRLCATVLLLLLSVCAFAVQKSGTIVYINGSKFYIHTVQPGETLYGLSKAYEVGEKVILQYNPSAGGGLKAGENVKIPFVTAVPEPKSERKLRRTFDSHTVAQGETLYAISRKYEIPIQTVIEDNPSLDPTNLRLGERILIRKKEIGSEDEAGAKEQWEAYRNTLNSVAEEGLYPVIRFAEEHNVPVVSPLANITGMNSDVLFQMAPDPAHKWEKAAELVNGDRQVTLIYTESTDKEFEQEMLTLLGDSDYKKHTYKYVHPSARTNSNSGDLTPLLDNGADNVFIVMSDNEVDVDRILAAIASADTNISSRGRTAPRFVVLGNTRWNRMNNIDRTMFFKDRVIFISTYHAKRDSQTILDFDSAYIRSFGSLPTLFSYRGYDAAAVFCPAMYNDIEYDMEGRSYTPLQTSYLFGQSEERHNHVNRSWMRVNYNSDFTITVE